MPAPSKPQLKVNALARLVVEAREYADEEKILSEKLAVLESAAPRDEYEIRRTKQVLDETKRVRARVLQMVREHVVEVRKLSGSEAKSPKALKALEDAAALE